MTRATDSDDCCCKDKKGDEEEVVPPKTSGPPDGGWGWMVVFASLMCNVVVDGICYTIGLFQVHFKNHFETSNTKVALVISLLAGCYLTVGPLVSALANRYGCRKVTMSGAVLAATAFLVGTQSSSIEMLIVTVGVFGGIGFGMIYLPAIVTVGFWFEKKRAFATGISVCGTGIGTFLFAPFVQYLLDEYSWKGSMVILGGVILNCVVFGAIFRPLYKTRKRTPRIVEIQRGSIMKALIEEKKRQRTISNGSLDNCIITKDNRLIKIDPSFFEAKRNNSFIARFKESLGFSTKSLDKSKQSLVIPSIVIDQVQQNGGSQSLSPIYKPKRKPRSSLSESDSGVASTTPDFVLTAKSCDIIPGNQPWAKFSQDSNLNMRSQSSHSVNCPVLPASGIGASVISIQVVPTTPQTRIRHRAYRSSNRSMAYSSRSDTRPASIVSGSVMSIPYSVQSVEEYEKDQSTFMKVLHFLKEMFDFHLLCSPMFALLVFASILSMLAFFVPFFYLPMKANDIGLSHVHTSMLMSIIGITNTVGRVICGWIADRPWADPLYLNNFALISSGVVTLLCPICTSFGALAVYAAVFGLSVAVFVSLRSILLVELLGLDLLTKSFGFLILFQGVASMVGPPLAGAILDSLYSVDACFYFAGGLLLVSGILGFPLRHLKRWEVGKQPAPLPEEIPITETLKLEQFESTI